MVKTASSSSSLLVILLHYFLVTMSSLLSPVAASNHGEIASWVVAGRSSDSMVDHQCRGSTGECFDDESNEFERGSSEIKRRVLAYATQYISYGALQANRVPCSERGASYYNCLPGAPANPYTRGCSSISRCARS